MEFPRIGSRNLKLSQVTSQVLASEIASNCYCPQCKQGPMDGITGIQLHVDEGGPESEPPPVQVEIKAGQPSICVFCGTMVIFQEDNGILSLREMNREDIRHMKEDPDNWSAFMKTKEMVEFFIEKAQVDGRRRYAGNLKKFYL